jgi:acyl carrier protein
MSNEEYVLDKVREAFRRTFDVDPQCVSMQTTDSDISGWDSTGHLSLAANLEEVFGINLDVDEVVAMENVSKMVRIITPKLAKKA